LVTFLYQNLLGREPDEEGLAHYVDGLEDGTYTPISLVTNIIDGMSDDDKAIFDARVEIANYFTDNQGDKAYTAENIEDARLLLSGTTDDVDTYLGALPDNDNDGDNGDEPVEGENIELTFAERYYEGTSGDDTFVANPATNDWGLVQNTLSSSDTIDGGGGNDMLIAQIRQEESFGGNATNIAPTTINVENIEIRTIDTAVTLDAFSMQGVEKFTMFNSSATLGITNINAKPEDQVFELRNVNPGADFRAMYNSDFQRDSENTMTLTIGTDAVSGDNLIGEGDEAGYYQKVQLLQFEIDGGLYTKEWDEGDEPATYQELAEDLTAWVEEEGLNIKVELRETPGVDAAIAPQKIVLTVVDGSFGEAGNWDVDTNIPLTSNSLTRATPGVVVEGLVESNLELNTVGSTAQGSHVDLTAVAGSYRGIEKITAEASGFNNLESLTSEDNSLSGVYDHYLQEVYFSGDGVFNLGASLSDLGFDRLSAWRRHCG